MPFRNPITTLSGILVAPAIQSPDYAASLPPSQIQVTGWRLNANPSYVAAESIYGKSFVAPSPYYASRNLGNLDIVQAMMLIANNPPRMLTLTNVNPMGVGFVSAGFFPQRFPVRYVPASSNNGIREKWSIRAYFFFSPIVAAPNGNAFGTMRVIQYNSVGGTISTTDSTLVVYGARNTSPATVSGEWIIGDSKTTSLPDDYPTHVTLNPLCTEFDVLLIVRGTVANQYQLGNPSWAIAQPTTTVGYTQ